MNLEHESFIEKVYDTIMDHDFVTKTKVVYIVQQDTMINKNLVQ